MAEAGGWIVAVLVAVVAVLVRCVERSRSERAEGRAARRRDARVSAQRDAIVDAAEANLEGLRDDLDGDDPEGDIASAADAARADR